MKVTSRENCGSTGVVTVKMASVMITFVILALMTSLQSLAAPMSLGASTDVENPCNAHTLLPSPGVLCYRDMGELLCMCQDESMALWTGNESTELKLSVSGVETQMKCSVTSQSQRTYELNKVVECRPYQCVWHPKLFSDSDLRIPPQARFPDYLYENITRTFNVSQVIRMLGCEAPFTFQGHAKLKCTSGGMWKFRSNRHVSSLCSACYLNGSDPYISDELHLSVINHTTYIALNTSVVTRCKPGYHQTVPEDQYTVPCSEDALLGTFHACARTTCYMQGLIDNYRGLTIHNLTGLELGLHDIITVSCPEKQSPFRICLRCEQDGTELEEDGSPRTVLSLSTPLSAELQENIAEMPCSDIIRLESDARQHKIRRDR